MLAVRWQLKSEINLRPHVLVHDGHPGAKDFLEQREALHQGPFLQQEVPLALQLEQYTGPVTLEWERAWHPEAVPLGEALGSLRRWADRYWPRTGQAP